ncbi:hypothetical protein MHB45_28135 [Peribacillus sp. FSL K6-5616]|uniref:hypothetical protein n=1 Tax=Peribacillus TaxID=2675229 RepID=UPI0030FBC210
MRLHLIENAIDSLNFGKDFYQKYFDLGDDKYLSDEIPGYLKMVVICFHQSIELFNKKLLMDIEQKLIINENSLEEYESVLKASKEDKRTLRIEYFIMSESYNFKTIDYSKTIDLVRDNFNLNKDEVKILVDLGVTRNRITHFGMDKVLDFYEVIRTINDSLALIVGFYYERLKSNRQISLYYSNIFQELNELLKQAIKVEKEAWEVYYSINFMNINYVFDSLTDEEFQLELERMGYSIEIELGECSDSPNLKMKIYDRKRQLFRELQTINIPRLDATILCESLENGPILLVIDHLGMLLEKEEHCYRYYNLKLYDDVINAKECFWETDSNKKHQRCQKDRFTEEFIKLQIKNYLKKSGFAEGG